MTNNVTVSTTSSISGRGTIQVGRLSQWLSGLPRDAEITITKDGEYNNPTDPGGEWRLTATIEKEK